MRQSKLYFQDSVSDVFLRSSYSSSQQSAIVFPRCTVYIIINYFVTGRFQCDESRLFGSPQFQKNMLYIKIKTWKILSRKKRESKTPSAYIQPVTSLVPWTNCSLESLTRLCSKKSFSAAKPALFRDRWLFIAWRRGGVREEEDIRLKTVKFSW